MSLRIQNSVQPETDPSANVRSGSTQTAAGPGSSNPPVPISEHSMTPRTPHPSVPRPASSPAMSPSVRIALTPCAPSWRPALTRSMPTPSPPPCSRTCSGAEHERTCRPVPQLSAPARRTRRLVRVQPRRPSRLWWPGTSQPFSQPSSASAPSATASLSNPNGAGFPGHGQPRARCGSSTASIIACCGIPFTGRIPSNPSIRPAAIHFRAALRCISGADHGTHR